MVTERLGTGDQWILGVDVGGTFTDVVLANVTGAGLAHVKVATTPQRPAEAVLDGIRQVLGQVFVDPQAVQRVVHATTLGTNLVLEQRGGPVAFVATAGFGDIVRIGQEIRTGPARFALLYDKPAQLVSGDMIFEISERIGARGEIVEPLDPAGVDALIERLGAAQPRGVAICLLHAYANPVHEQKLRAALERALPDVHVAASSDVWPEYREYERAMTTVVSAYIGPAFDRYLTGVDKGLRELGIPAPLEVMQSSGGIMSAVDAGRKAVFCIESGPAAGVVAVSRLARERSIPNVLAFDMGGTTSKAGLVIDGRVEVTQEFHVGGGVSVGLGRRGTGVPVRVPVVDTAEIGTGGGSIAWVDDGGYLRVGPESAGAEPGPACYGRGGTKPTVTDADIVLGYLDPDARLGGTTPLDYDAAVRAIEMHVAEPLGMDVLTAARGIFDIATEQVTGAARLMSLYRGIDPRQLQLVAYGGAGPVHAVHIADRVGISSVVVPRLAGVFSALGLILSPRSSDAVRTDVVPLDDPDAEARLTGILVALEHDASSVIGASETSGTAVERVVGLRHRRQAHELFVTLDGASGRDGLVDQLESGFRAKYLDEFRLASSDPIEAVTYRVRVHAMVESQLAGLDLGRESMEPVSANGVRAVSFAGHSGAIDSIVLQRAALVSGSPVEGPALIEEPDTTTAVPPGWQGQLDAVGDLVVSRSTGSGD